MLWSFWQAKLTSRCKDIRNISLSHESCLSPSMHESCSWGNKSNQPQWEEAPNLHIFTSVLRHQVCNYHYIWLCYFQGIDGMASRGVQQNKVCTHRNCNKRTFWLHSTKTKLSQRVLNRRTPENCLNSLPSLWKQNLHCVERHNLILSRGKPRCKRHFLCHCSRKALDVFLDNPITSSW